MPTATLITTLHSVAMSIIGEKLNHGQLLLLEKSLMVIAITIAILPTRSSTSIARKFNTTNKAVYGYANTAVRLLMLTLRLYIMTKMAYIAIMS